MNNFETVWEKFSYVLEEMRNGMAFFEGFILNVSLDTIDSGIKSLCSPPYNATLNLSTWSNDSSKEDWARNYSVEKYVELYKTGKIITLQPEYLTHRNGHLIHLKLMVEEWEDKAIIEIMCYRDLILNSPTPKLAVHAAILEFIRIKELFLGSTLFIGPDTLNYPESDNYYPKEWIKIVC
jgi:hypothetical protein